MDSLASGRLEVRAVLSGTLAAGARDTAFAVAADRQQHMKAQLMFDA